MGNKYHLEYIGKTREARRVKASAKREELRGELRLKGRVES
jgi:hypothetical protein